MLKQATLAVLLLTIVAMTAQAATAFFQYENTEGLTKVCVYKSYKGTHAITLKSYQVCPVTIEV